MTYNFSSRARIPSRAARAAVGVCNLMTWISALIVTSITGYFLRNFRHDGHLIFEIVIASLVLGLWIPGLVLPYFSGYRSFYAIPNFIFSYLWLTSFIFAAQDYNRGNCRWNAPRFGRCSLKLGSESFIFLAFFFTLLAFIIDVLAWKNAAVVAAEPVHPEKPTEPAPAATTAV